MKTTLYLTVSALIWLTAFGVMAIPVISAAQSPKQSEAAAEPSKNVDKGEQTPAGQPEAAAAKPSANKPPAVSPKKVPPPDPNRRWIMRQRDHSSKNITAKPPKPLKWRSKAQRTNCQAKDQSLEVTFDRARYYSIQGDRCKTAQYAQSFLKIAGQCRTECPDGFLERNGYNEQVVRNMHQLKLLGTESCFGKKGRPSALKKTTNPGQHTPSSVKQ